MSDCAFYTPLPHLDKSPPHCGASGVEAVHVIPALGSDVGAMATVYGRAPNMSATLSPEGLSPSASQVSGLCGHPYRESQNKGGQCFPHKVGGDASYSQSLSPGNKYIHTLHSCCAGNFSHFHFNCRHDPIYCYVFKFAKVLIH